MSNTSTSETCTANTCANCGKEGNDVANTCNKCKSVIYCNAACKKKHRHKHKKQCERRVAELHEEALFKQPPPKEDCPICMIRSPSLNTGSNYMSCCGKVICCGCSYAPVYDNQGNEVVKKICPFCRTPPASSDGETIKRFEKRIELNDPYAIYSMGCKYAEGLYGLPQNYAKSLELYHQAGELGNAEAYYNIGYAYRNGRGVEVDEKKSTHYLELAAMQGHTIARHNLGCIEGQAGNVDRALKHLMIAVKDGSATSLKNIKYVYANGHATKDDYAKALRLYQAYLDEIKSDQRDEAAAFWEDYKYYESSAV